jgi:nicotinate-nucleotide adenylyltransferase
MTSTRPRANAPKIGILGGTFNPVHIGHLLMARDAWEQAGLDAVELVPCHLPPHKGDDDLVSARHRLRMLRLAVRGVAGLRVNDIEVRRGGRSYSVDTVAALQEARPGVTFYFIIGSDSLPELPKWRDYGRLTELCEFIVVTRPGHGARKPRGVRVAATVTGHVCDVSSTDIRKRIARGRGIHYLAPDAVRRYIEREHLYH